MSGHWVQLEILFYLNRTPAPKSTSIYGGKGKDYIDFLPKIFMFFPFYIQSRSVGNAVKLRQFYRDSNALL